MRALVLTLLAAAALLLPVPAAGQAAATQPAQPQPQAAGAASQEIPVSIDRIRDALERPHVLSIPKQDVTFRVTVYGRPLLSDFAESLKVGPQPVVSGGFTHNEFLRLTTPPQAQPYAAFTGWDLLSVAAQSLVSSLALNGAVAGIQALQRSWREREEAKAREEVRREFEAYLASLKKKQEEIKK